MQLLTPLDPTLARETYLHALEAAIITGGPAAACGRWPRPPAPAPAPSESPQPADLLLDGLVTIFTRRYEAGVPGLRSALDAFCSEGQPADAGRRSDSHRWLWHATRAAASLFDDEMIYELATRNVRLARETGALATLPSALISLSITQALTGELAHAAELAAEETAIRVATGAVPLRHHVQLIQTAWRGLSDETVEIHAAIVREAAGRWRGTEVSLAQYALAVLHNGLGDFPAAREAAALAFESEELNHSSLALPEFIEAAGRSGQPERAAAALKQVDGGRAARLPKAAAAGTPFSNAPSENRRSL